VKYDRNEHRVGVRKMSKSETRKSSFSDRPYDMNKVTMNQLYKRMRTKRLNRQEKFVGK